METIEKEIKSRMDKVNPQKEEGPVAAAIEEQTAKIPSDMYLWASFASMFVSFGLKAFKKDTASMFFGVWSQAFLLFGIYNKLVKQSGHD